MSFYNGKNVLVCGGAGLLGQSLIPKLLAEGANVRATEHYGGRGKIDPAVRDKIDIWQTDLISGAAGVTRLIQDNLAEVIKDVDIVFYCAAKVGGAKSIRNSPATRSASSAASCSIRNAIRSSCRGCPNTIR